MKKFFLLLSLLFSQCYGYTQWQADIRLTNNPATSSFSQNNAKCMVSNNDTIHIVWTDTRDGNPEIYYKRSTDGGLNWSADIRITNDLANSSSPAMDMEGQNVHIVWEDNRDGNSEIYYIRSTNSGISWESETRLTNTTENSSCPSIAATGQWLKIVWCEGFSIQYNSSSDRGINWGISEQLMWISGVIFNAPSIAASGLNVVVASSANNNGTTIYYRRSLVGGGNWNPLSPLATLPGTGYTPNVSISGSVVHVFWADSRDGGSEIYYKRSPDVCLNWGPDTRLTNDPGYSFYPYGIATNFDVALTWIDDRDGNNEIYYLNSPDGGLSWEPELRLTNNDSSSIRPFAAINGSKVFVAWTDDRNANSEIYFNYNPTGINTVIDDENDWDNSISLYPNPATDYIALDCSCFENNNYFIYNNTGAIVLEGHIYGTGKVGIEKLPAGIYLVKIVNDDRIVQKKLIKE